MYPESGQNQPLIPASVTQRQIELGVIWNGRDLHFLQSERLPSLRGHIRGTLGWFLEAVKQTWLCVRWGKEQSIKGRHRSLSFTLSLRWTPWSPRLSSLPLRVCKSHSTARPWCQSTFTAYYSNQSKHPQTRRRAHVQRRHKLKTDSIYFLNAHSWS